MKQTSDWTPEPTAPQPVPHLPWKRPTYLSWSFSLRGRLHIYHTSRCYREALRKHKPGDSILAHSHGLLIAPQYVPERSGYPHLGPQFMQYPKRKKAVDVIVNNVGQSFSIISFFYTVIGLRIWQKLSSHKWSFYRTLRNCRCQYFCEYELKLALIWEKKMPMCYFKTF